ncbi:DUF4038 domain-containing protein [Pelagicoccus mobilis]|uniref:DUF4038 domain-containing protein n=1 Tax=Pelagicoccus mobilis TaxID=415221 RepID=A0A934RY84_9BACT|nr:DUF4038 domain-containing protein [Pelagicoccus mobilis]MBK1878771.1 DUF4038 domain-containing protein [Pelagicoccus mobilis]
MMLLPQRDFRTVIAFLVSLFVSIGCAQSQEPERMLIVDPENPRWLRWSDGDPFFMCGPGDPESFLFRGERQADGTRKGDQMELLRKVADAGANCIWWVGLRSHGGDGGPLENMFIDGDPSKGLDHDILDQWEEWLAEAERLGIVVFFFFYDDQVEVEIGPGKIGWMLDEQGNLHQDEAAMIREVVSRFSKYGNLVWGPMEVADKRGKRFVPHLKAMAKYIKEVDPHPHPVAMSVGFLGDSFSEYANDPNVDIYSVMKLERLSADEINQRGLGYFAAAEDRYICSFSETHGYGKGEVARHKNWATAMSGCYVMIHGHHVYNNTEQDLIDCARVTRFFERTNFYDMVPNNRLAKGETKYVMEKPGREYILYSRASSERGALSLLEAPLGEYSLLWLDCINGKELEENVTITDRERGVIQFQKPHGFGPEIALHAVKK